MSLAVSWLLFPLVFGLLSLGCGLLLEQVAGMQLPRALLVPAGFSVIAVVGLATTTNHATAQLTTPAVLALAVAGLALSLPWHVPRVGWAAAGATGAFAAVGAPVFLSGSATFAGYITLDDTASWLGFADRLLEHGRNLTNLAPSSYEAMLNYYWNQYGYPVGAFPPLGIAHTLLGTDSAWLFQPYIAFLAAMLALCLYTLVERVIESPWLQALAAFVAAQPALLYAYSQWGGVKEVGTSAMFVLVAALTPTALRERARARTLLPLAMATAALLGILNVSSGVWIAPLLVPVLVLGFRRRGPGFARLAGAFVAFVVVLSIPSLLIARTFVSDVSLNSKGGDIGNLIHPLSWLQIFGIWPVGDFRVRPGDIDPTYVLIGLVIAAGTGGVVWALRRRVWELPLFVCATAVGCTLAVHVGSAWIGAKALAIASPAPILAGMTGTAWLFKGGRRVEAAVAVAAIAGGVLWSNALIYHDAWLAPRSQLSELETIGKQFSGDGPALMTEYQSYGVRHFLRSMDPESAGELRYRPVLLRNGREVAKGDYSDIDQFQLDAILVYRTLVLVRSPSASRPPSIYNLVWSGRYYDVWQRPEASPVTILEHFPLGEGVQPAAVPVCSEVIRLGRLAGGRNGRLAAVARPSVTVVGLASTIHPATWQTFSGSPDVVYPSRSGTLEASVSVRVTGRYGFWLAGSFRRRLELSIDGRHLATARHRLNHPGVDTPLGEDQLQAGTHRLVLRYSAANLSPGSGGRPFPLGPLVLSRFTAEQPLVANVQPADARSLCGKSLDWIEAVAG